eukprot:SAG31_NODE_3036_length_4763_cov_3.456046_4_plen_145_part_00
MDVTVLIGSGEFSDNEEKRKFAQKAVKKLATALKHCPNEFTAVQPVPTARVPIVRAEFVYSACHAGALPDASTKSVHCDISIENRLAVHNTRLLRAYGKLDSRFLEVAKPLKLWGRARKIIGGTGGLLTSYALNLMLLFYLQVK